MDRINKIDKMKKNLSIVFIVSILSKRKFLEDKKMPNGQDKQDGHDEKNLSIVFIVFILSKRVF